MVRVGEEERRFAPLPVRKVPGIGPVTESRLVAAGIRTIGQLLELPSGPLRTRFGSTAEWVRRALDPSTGTRLARDRPAFLELDSKHETVGSISNERTFSSDIGDRDRVERQLLALCERVCWRARRRETRARTVALKIRYSDFETLTRSRTLDRPTNLEQRVYATVLQLLKGAWTRKRPLAWSAWPCRACRGPRLNSTCLARSLGPSPSAPPSTRSGPASATTRFGWAPPGTHAGWSSDPSRRALRLTTTRIHPGTRISSDTGSRGPAEWAALVTAWSRNTRTYRASPCRWKATIGRDSAR